MLTRCKHALACSALMLGTALPVAAQPVELDWKFEPGSTHKYRTNVTQQQTVKSEQLPQPMNVTQMTGMDQSYKVLEVAQGVATVQITTDAVRMKASNPMMGMNIDYDSTSGDDPPQEVAALESLIGTSYSVSIDKSGKVTNVQGVAELLEKLTQGVNPAAGQMLSAMLSEDAVKTQFEQQFRLLPEQPVAEGDSWNSALDMPMPGLGTVTIKTDYTYKGDSKKDQATDHVVFKGNADLDTSELPQNVDLSLKKGDISGSFDFSQSLGQLVNFEQVLSLVLEVTQQGQPFQIELDQTTKTELID